MRSPWAARRRTPGRAAAAVAASRRPHGRTTARHLQCRCCATRLLQRAAHHPAQARTNHVAQSRVVRHAARAVLSRSSAVARRATSTESARDDRTATLTSTAAAEQRRQLTCAQVVKAQTDRDASHDASQQSRSDAVRVTTPVAQSGCLATPCTGATRWCCGAARCCATWAVASPYGAAAAGLPLRVPVWTQASACLCGRRLADHLVVQLYCSQRVVGFGVSQLWLSGLTRH